MQDEPEPRSPADRAVALGRDGAGRREIATALQLTLRELGLLERSDAGFAHAMELAEEAARAWWDRLGREALLNGARLDRGAFVEGLLRRFGKPQGQGDPAKPPEPEVEFYFPDNGTKRKRRRPRW